MNVDNHILGLLSDGTKSYTELEKVIVPKICAKGTLSKHLKNLERGGKIHKDLLPDRRTRYSLMPKHASAARSAMDVISLESLITQLEYKTRKELTLEDAIPEDVKGRDRRTFLAHLEDLIAGFKNKPKMRFILQLDKETLNIVNLIEPTSDIASELERLVRGKLESIKLGMPAVIKDEMRFLTAAPRNWNETKEFSRKFARKHGLRFLVVSWYDGKEYRRRIESAIQKLEKLEKNHMEDIYFLEEVNKRCFYASLEYYYEPELVLEDVTSGLLEVLDPYQLLENAFWCYFWKKQELAWLEAALISSNPSAELPEGMMIEEWKTLGEEMHSPYPILSAKAYVRMKLPFLDGDEKELLVKGLLKYLKEAGKDYSRDFQLHPNDYRLAIDLLLEKLNADDNAEKEIGVRSPIMNFQFCDRKRRLDFSDLSLVENFLLFMKNSKKRRWLQKCLSLGLPTFKFIPFDKLRFAVKNIL